ncbi:hypothetical protein KNJ79_04935 [Sphingopyxis indica]|uniref:hypothetical protein n=1 Tax=Sphingopyxis indica TaxID=436663 RepID=UPI0029393CA3|nr:hypothetical protein [Sphingopyxis indica]WOF44276.1 hypothetical protein KNJ79_04935 [Sphingopyxis indica]
MNKFIELIRDEIHAGVEPSDVLDALADATIPLISTVSETSELTPPQVLDYFQHRQDQIFVHFIQAH